MKEYSNKHFRYAKVINKAMSVRLQKPEDQKLEIDADQLVFLGNVGAGSSITVRPNLNLKLNISDPTSPYEVEL